MLTQALQNPGDTNYTVLATVIQVGAIEYSGNTGKPYQRTQLNDGQIECPVRIWQGNGIPLTPAHIGQRFQFSVSGWQSPRDGKVYVSGFWQSQATVGISQAPPSPVFAQAVKSAFSAVPKPVQKLVPAPVLGGRSEEESWRIIRQNATGHVARIYAAAGVERCNLLIDDTKEQETFLRLARTIAAFDWDGIINIPDPSITATEQEEPDPNF